MTLKLFKKIDEGTYNEAGPGRDEKLPVPRNCDYPFKVVIEGTVKDVLKKDYKIPEAGGSKSRKGTDEDGDDEHEGIRSLLEAFGVVDNLLFKLGHNLLSQSCVNRITYLHIIVPLYLKEFYNVLINFFLNFIAYFLLYL